MDDNLLPYLSDTERGWLALAEAATPGPWRVAQNPVDLEEVEVFAPLVASGRRIFWPLGAALDDADAAFIAAARTALPAVLEALALARRDAANEAQARRDAVIETGERLSASRPTNSNRTEQKE